MDLHRCYGCMEMISEKVCPHCGYSQDQNNDSNQLPVGTMLRDQYLVGKVLGQGGFGITYMGWDTVFDRAVAIKEFFPSSAVNRDVSQSLLVKVNTASMEKRFFHSRDRFLREAKTLALLQDVSNIVGIHGYFPLNNTAYIIMDFVRGITLKQYVQKNGRPFSSEELFHIIEPVMLALDHVHKSGLVHRDISPDNIMIQPDGTPILLDFGAVRDLHSSDSDIDLSHSTESILKHGYAPMEQYRSRGNLGPWTDEYGLCSTIYFSLTGNVPPDAPARAMGDAHPDWDSIPGLTDTQLYALKKGTAMNAKDRFGNIHTLHSALYSKESPVITFSVLPGKPRRAVRFAALAAAALVVLTGTVLLARGTENNFSTPPETSTVHSQAPASHRDPGAPEVLLSSPWEANILMKDPLSALPVERYQIQSVSFLDSTAGAPDNSVDVSSEGSGQVLAWTKDSQVFIAADGGINAMESCEGLFQECTGLKSVNFGGAFHTDYTTSMERMFYGCYQLTQVDAETLETGSVTNMCRTFDLSTPLKKQDGTLIEGMMVHPTDLRELFVGGWDVSNVTTMEKMFSSCNRLTSLDLSRWDVSSVTNMSNMFFSCEQLRQLDIGNWDVSGVTTMKEMFFYCKSLVTVDVSSWDVSGVTDMYAMFRTCLHLESLHVGNWDVSSVTDMGAMFMGCNVLSTLDVTNWDVSGVTNMTRMFSGTGWQLQPDFSRWDVSQVETYDHFFTNGRTWRHLFEN